MEEMKNKKWKPEVIVLGPGGMKGFLEIGALIKLSETGMLDRVNTYIGCSVGAIISLLMVAGFNPMEIIMEAMNTQIFRDILNISLSELQTKKEQFGLISTTKVRDQLTKKLVEKFGFVPTLKQLYIATGMTLITVSVNLDKDRTEYFSWKTEPDISAVEATVLSMNIPFLFYKITYKGDVYIDGAFGNPYPVDICDDGETDILGISITTKHPYMVDATDTNNLRYIYKVLNASITQLKKRIEKNCTSKCKHLALYSPSMDTTGLTFDEDTKSEMIKIGYNLATGFIEQLEGEEIILVTSEEVPFSE